MFKGSFNSQIQENHVFLSDDPIMEAIGLSSFSTKSFQEIITNNFDGIKLVYPSIANRLNNIVSLIDLIDVGTYKKFNSASSKYEPQEISSAYVQDLIDYHEQKTKTPFKDIDSIKDEYKDNQIIDIENSLTGSILFKLPKSSFNITDTDNPDIRINLFFIKSSARNNNKRIMAQKGPPMIVSTPRRATGGTYGFRQTKTTQTSEETNNIGAYENATDQGVEDINNTVGAPLKLTYNQNTKMWESGTTQILAKLTEDVAAAEIKNVQIGRNDIDSLTGSEQFYSADSPYYMGGYVTTLAIPLSLENGNPNLFGPNLLKCKDGKCETIRAINRAPRSFSAGSIVLLSNIDGEWIIQDFGANPADLKPSKTSFGEWSFTKLIADSDAYFKDAKFYTQGTDSESVLAPLYEEHSRNKFYNNAFKNLVDNATLKGIYISNELGLMKIYNLGLSPSSTFQPSKRYYISTIFDQIGKKHGGFSDRTYITNTNVKSSTFPNGADLASQVPMFWGPVFTDGYTSLATNVTTNQINQDQYIYIDPDPDTNPISLPSIMKEHFPAELSSKIIDIIPIINDWNNLGNKTIKQNNIKPPFYGSNPNSINKIQFSPLQLDFAAHDDPVSILATSENRRYYLNFRSFMRLILGLGTNDPLDKHFWGNMYNRANVYNNSLLLSVKENFDNILLRLNLCGAYNNITKESLDQWKDEKFLAYDCYVSQTPTNVPIGAPQEFRDNNDNKRGANLIGVTAAKQTITKAKGGIINFSCDQDVGLTGRKIVSGSAGVFSIIMGVIVNSVSPSLNQYGFPQWGSSLNDRYDSFGTTALHVRIFDYWPEENTIYDPRYYGILHFNPGEFNSTVTSTYVGLSDESIQEKYGAQYSKYNLPPTISYVDIPREVDQTNTSTSTIDLRIPTLGIKFKNNSPPETTYDNDIVKTGMVVRSDGIRIQTGSSRDFLSDDPNATIPIFDWWPLRPNNEWRINPIRRGQMLTNGGFSYLYHAIGLSNSFNIIDGGSGFENNQKFKLGGSKSIEIQITATEGKITNIIFISTDPEIIANQNGPLNSDNGRGVNFTPSDFPYKLTIPAQNGGKSALIEFPFGVVYQRNGKDLAPKEQLKPTLISSGSKKGEGRVTAVKDSQFTLEENDSNKYDCFYFFHNDITHTDVDPLTLTIGYAQYINLTVS